MSRILCFRSSLIHNLPNNGGPYRQQESKGCGRRIRDSQKLLL